MTNLTKIWVCSQCKNEYQIKPDTCRFMMIENVYCTGVMMPFISQKELVEYLAKEVEKVVMNTMYDGSMGIMVDPDLAVFNKLHEILNHIKGE